MSKEKDTDISVIDLEAKKEVRRIPVLRDTSVGEEGPPGTIPDSSAICAYVERKFPEPALYPSDAFEHGPTAKVHDLLHQVSGATGLLGDDL